MKKTILKASAVLMSAVLFCGNAFAAVMPKNYEKPETVAFDDGSRLDVTTTMNNYYDELKVSFDGEEYSLSVVLAPESGKQVFSTKINNMADFPNGGWMYAFWSPYVYSEESKILMINGEEYHEEGVSIDNGTVTYTFDSEMAGVCKLEAAFQTTPEDSGYFATNRSWMLVLTQSDIDTYLSTGKIYGHAFPGLKELLQNKEAGEPEVKPETKPETKPEEKPIGESVTAAPTASKVTVNGEQVSFNAYSINDNNYFKLRDISKVISGSGKQFDVSWDGDKNAINLLSGKEYTVVGGELAEVSTSGNKAATLNTAQIYLDGELVTLTAYTIDGNNYFKLRDLGQTFNFGVVWDGASNTIAIDTDSEYSAE